MNISRWGSNTRTVPGGWRRGEGRKGNTSGESVDGSRNVKGDGFSQNLINGIPINLSRVSQKQEMRGGALDP